MIISVNTRAGKFDYDPDAGVLIPESDPSFRIPVDEGKDERYVQHMVASFIELFS